MKAGSIGSRDAKVMNRSQNESVRMCDFSGNCHAVILLAVRKQCPSSPTGELPSGQKKFGGQGA